MVKKEFNLILNIRDFMANKASSHLSHKSGITYDIQKQIDKGYIKPDSFENISRSQARQIGMKQWDEESDIFLFPLWLFIFLPEGFNLKSIDGSDHIYSSELDTDIRFGCVSYGIEIDDNDSCLFEIGDIVYDEGVVFRICEDTLFSRKTRHATTQEKQEHITIEKEFNQPS